MIKNKFKFDKYVLNKAEGILSQKLINEIKLKINSEIKNLTNIVKIVENRSKYNDF